MEVLPNEIILEIFNKMHPETRMVCQHVYGRFAALARPINPCYLLKSVVLLNKTQLLRYKPEVIECQSAFNIIETQVELELKNYGPLHCIEHIPPLGLIQATKKDFIKNVKLKFPRPCYMVNASKLIICCESNLWAKSARFMLKHKSGHSYCKKLNIKHRLHETLCHVSHMHNIYVIVFYLIYFLTKVLNVSFTWGNRYIIDVINFIQEIKQK